MIRVIFSNKTSTWFQAALIRILNLMNPVSVKVGGHLDRYMAKVTLEYEGHTDNETLDILREAAYLKEAFCASCDVFVYDLDEEGNPVQTNGTFAAQIHTYDCSGHHTGEKYYASGETPLIQPEGYASAIG